MKFKKLIGGLLLSSVLAAGVGVSISSQMSVKEANAAGTTFGAGTNIYLAGNGDIDITGCYLSAWVHYTSGSHWESFSFDDLSGYYMITLDSNASALTFARTEKGSDGGTNWSDVGSVYNQTDMDFVSGKNWIWPKSWNNSITCEWRYIHYHIGGSFNGWVMNQSAYQMTDGFDDSGNHQASFTLTTSVDDVVLKAATLYNGTSTMNYYGELEPGYNTNFIGNDSSGNIQLKKAGTYELYLKSNRKVWAQVSSATEADSYAQTFLSSITCTSDSTTFAINVWNKVGSATTSMEYKFEHLTTGAQNVLKGATPSESGSNVEQCMARYIRILSKYGYGESGPYHDFMGKAPARLGSGAILLNSIVSGSSGTMIAIIAISSVSIAAIGGYFLLRKKKND